MTKEVILSIKGLQFDSVEENPDPVEIVTVGEYYKEEEAHHVIFDEIMEGFEGITKNTIRITEHTLDISKQGITNVHMMFEKNKKNVTSYNTPYGNLMIGILASQVKVNEKEDDIDIHVDYALEMNYEHLADCQIRINIKSKDSKDFSLEETI